jgi:excisionase family DNA binding protein
MSDPNRKPARPALVPVSPPFEQLLDSDEAAVLLKIHPKTLQRMARNGEIAGIQIGKLWRFRASELDRWISGRIAG